MPFSLVKANTKPVMKDASFSSSQHGQAGKSVGEVNPEKHATSIASGGTKFKAYKYTVCTEKKLNYSKIKL